MVKHLKTINRETENVAEYPGIKRIKQRNQMRHNNIRLKTESGHFQVTPSITLINQRIRKYGNRIKGRGISQDFSMRYIYKSVLGRLEEIKENATTHMIKIFEAEPEPELIYIKNSPEKRYESIVNKEHRKPEVGNPDYKHFALGILSLLLEIYNKIHLSFALDYELNVDPQLENRNEKRDIPPKVRQFTPAAINALKIGFSKTFKSLKTAFKPKIRESRKKIVNLSKSVFSGKLKTFSPININSIIHRQQLE